MPGLLVFLGAVIYLPCLSVCKCGAVVGASAETTAAESCGSGEQ